MCFSIWTTFICLHFVFKKNVTWKFQIVNVLWTELTFVIQTISNLNNPQAGLFNEWQASQHVHSKLLTWLCRFLKPHFTHQTTEKKNIIGFHEKFIKLYHPSHYYCRFEATASTTYTFIVCHGGTRNKVQQVPILILKC